MQSWTERLFTEAEPWLGALISASQRSLYHARKNLSPSLFAYSPEEGKKDITSGDKSVAEALRISGGEEDPGGGQWGMHHLSPREGGVPQGF